MKESEPKLENNDAEIIKRLTELIREVPYFDQLTVCVMGLRDLEEGHIDSALLRLQVDLDKFPHDKILVNYVRDLINERGLRGKSF